MIFSVQSSAVPSNISFRSMSSFEDHPFAVFPAGANVNFGNSIRKKLLILDSRYPADISSAFVCCRRMVTL